MSDLIDRQALRAAHGLGSDCHDCKRDMKSCQYDRDYSLMDFCEWLDDAPTASPWHRVEERLPNVDEKVLVFAVGKLDGFIGDTVIALTSMSDTNWLNHHEKVDKPYWLDPWQYFLTDYRITHWMPLPEPPKEGV